MFHQGTLQSGISLAIQEQKLVACFVRDDGDESTLWENDWLQSGWLSSLLAQKSVLLRLEAGSTEAGFLSAFCPIPTTPTFVIIHNGQLRDQISSGVDKDTFINRIRNVLGADPIPGVVTQSTEASAEVPRETPPTLPTETTAAPVLPNPSPPTSSTPPLSAKAKGKQKATPPEPASNVSSNTSVQQAAREAARRKKQEEKDELARIQARIEQDKIARKAEAEIRRIERERERSSTPQQASVPAARISNSKASQAKQVNLNVRLFDGRTVRSTFPRTATLQDDVRPWIDEQVAANAENPGQKQPPFFFKQIQAPLPSRELTTGEENESLGDIGLAPSATLVLIPVKGYTEAYSGGGGGVVGSVTGLVGGAFGLAYNAVGYVGSTLGSIVGIGGQPTSAQGQGQASTPSGRTLDDNTSNDAGGSGSIRVRTLADQRERDGDRGREFYNGNQLNFEPTDDSNRK